MKKSIFFSILILSATMVITLVACKKNTLDPSFKAQARLMLSGVADEGARADSLGFSFAIWPTSVKDTQLTVVAQLMGDITGTDRSFDIEVDPASTALADEYQLPSSFVLPAGSFRTSFPVTIKRSARLTNATASLILKVKANENFVPGPVYSNTVNLGPAFRIVWTEVLTQPASWNTSMLFAVGRWSRVKHQAIIDVTGIRNYDNLNYSQTYAIASAMLDWLNAYNASHPGNPLKDENGLEVRICSQCN